MPRKRPEQGYVYFVRCGDYVKIGHSWSPESRLRELQVNCPYPFSLIAQYAGTLTAERALHHMFRQHRHRGEWFHWCDEIARVAENGPPAHLTFGPSPCFAHIAGIASS